MKLFWKNQSRDGCSQFSERNVSAVGMGHAETGSVLANNNKGKDRLALCRSFFDFLSIFFCVSSARFEAFLILRLFSYCQEFFGDFFIIVEEFFIIVEECVDFFSHNMV